MLGVFPRVGNANRRHDRERGEEVRRNEPSWKEIVQGPDHPSRDPSRGSLRGLGWRARYENEPSQELIALFADAAGPSGTVGIVQIRNRKAGRKLIDFLDGAFDHFIIWARDHRTYRAIVDNLEAQSDTRLQ